MARPLSYPFNLLENVGDSFVVEPAQRKRGHPCDEQKVDSVAQAQVKADRYSKKHFSEGSIRVSWHSIGFYRFERVPG